MREAMRYVQRAAAAGALGVALTLGAAAPTAGALAQEPPRPPRPDGLHLPLPESSYRPLIPELPEWSRQPQRG